MKNTHIHVPNNRGTLEQAIMIATTVHAGTHDKSGAAYILHPLRVMMAMDDDPSRIVAVLHDVVEDSKPPNKWGFSELRREGFSEEVLSALDGVTRREDETYEDFIARSQDNPIARKVKIADLHDNLDIRRIAHELTERDCHRIGKYQRALAVLQRNSGEK